LLPAQTSGGTRHAALKGINSGEVHAENYNVLSSDMMKVSRPTIEFAETFNNALKLSDEDVAKIIQPKKPARPPVTSGSPLDQALPRVPPTLGSFEEKSIVKDTEYKIAEKVVDAATPLAIAQFTNSDVDAISFVKGSEQSINLRSNHAHQNNETFFTLNSTSPAQTENEGTSLGFKINITEASNRTLSRSEINQVEDIPHAPPIRQVVEQAFETIKGRSAPTLSNPETVTENSSGIVPTRSLDGNMIGYVSVTAGTGLFEDLGSVTPSLAINNNGSEVDSKETEVSHLLPQHLTLESLRDTLPLDRFDSISNFRGVLTQDDLEGLIARRNLPHTPQITPESEVKTETLIPIIDGTQGSETPTERTYQPNIEAETPTANLEIIRAQRHYTASHEPIVNQNIDSQRIQNGTEDLVKDKHNDIKISGIEPEIIETQQGTFSSPSHNPTHNEIPAPSLATDSVQTHIFEQNSRLDRPRQGITPEEDKHSKSTLIGQQVHLNSRQGLAQIIDGSDKGGQNLENHEGPKPIPETGPVQNIEIEKNRVSVTNTDVENLPPLASNSAPVLRQVSDKNTENREAPKSTPETGHVQNITTENNRISVTNTDVENLSPLTSDNAPVLRQDIDKNIENQEAPKSIPETGHVQNITTENNRISVTNTDVENLSPLTSDNATVLRQDSDKNTENREDPKSISEASAVQNVEREDKTSPIINAEVDSHANLVSDNDPALSQDARTTPQPLNYTGNTSENVQMSETIAFSDSEANTDNISYTLPDSALPTDQDLSDTSNIPHSNSINTDELMTRTPEMAVTESPPQALHSNLGNGSLLENNRGTISLPDFQLAASHQPILPAMESSKTVNQKNIKEVKEARDTEFDIDLDNETLSSDIRDIEIDTDDIDGSDYHFDQIDSDFETAKSPPQFGQTALAPLAMSTASSPVFQPIIGLGGELMSPLAMQAQSLSPSSTILAQSPTVRQAVVTAVSDAILTAKETPKGIVVQLDPPEMGRVYIDFLFEGDNNVTVVMKSESADSQAILRERQEQFQALLKDSGFENITMSFEQQNSNGNEGSGSDTQGKDINIGLSALVTDTQSDSYNQPIYQISDDVIRLDMRL